MDEKSLVILKALSRPPIAYYSIYHKLTKHIPTAVFLSHLMPYFNEMESDKVPLSDGEVYEELCLTPNELRMVKKKVKSIPFLTVTKEGQPGRLFYEIDWEKYQDYLESNINLLVGPDGNLST